MERPTGTVLHRLVRDGLDTRFVLQAYGAVAIVIGLSIAGTGIRGLSGVPLAHASIIWISGTAIVAAGCAALGLALNNDPLGRRQSLYCFAAGHILLGLMMWMQWGVYWRQQGLPHAAALAPLLTGLVLLAVASYSRVAAESTSSRIRSAYDEHIRQLARREERARLARDLHDAVKQQLFVIQASAATAQMRLTDDGAGAREALVHVRTAAREATTEMEALLDELQAAPMEMFGLVEALKKQCEALALRTGADVRFRPGTLPLVGTLSPGAHEVIYRVAQEALANVGRHARASRVTVSLQASATHFELGIADNGGGFDAGTRRSGMGITNMETRAAEIGGRVSIGPASPGTNVVLTVPLTDPAVRTSRRMAAMFGLMAVFFVVFFAVRGESPDRWTLAFYGGFAVLFLINSYRRQRTR